MSRRVQLSLIAVGLVIFSGGAAAWPLIQAQNRYSVADKAFDSDERCTAAGEIATAWARLGFSDYAREWKEKEYWACRFAHPNRH